MTKKKEAIPPQPIGKGIVANATWLCAYRTWRIIAVGLTATFIGVVIAFTVAIIASTDIKKLMVNLRCIKKLLI